MPTSSLNFISRAFRWNQMRKGKQPQPGWGEKLWEAPRWVCAGWGAVAPPLCLSLMQVYSLSSYWESCFWTITHLSAINRPPKCGVLSPNLWIMIIGGKCLWVHSYWELGVLQRIYLLKISQQPFSLHPSSLRLCFLNIHETCSNFRLKISQDE